MVKDLESKTKNKYITLTIQSRGMIAFSETGILPLFVVFHFRELRRTWRFKQTKDTQNGVLKVNGQVAFNYLFDGLGCKMQSVKNGIATSEWDIEETMMEMRD